jgi:hypothetical protein
MVTGFTDTLRQRQAYRVTPVESTAGVVIPAHASSR